MACPFTGNGTKPRQEDKDNNDSLTYSSYLKVHDLLNCMQQQTEHHDEHLFIITHQVYELWFKQVLFEIDSVRDIFAQPCVDEREMLKINRRLGRVVKIFTVLVDQINILETMTPLDFAEFRSSLGTSSGFQSWQFRLIENKIGVKATQRIQYNQSKYSEIFDEQLREMIEKSETEPSLASLVASWLERTPDLATTFDFWKEFINTCNDWFTEELGETENETDNIVKENLKKSCNEHQTNFKQIFVKETYDELVMRGDRSFSWGALKGALMIYYFRDEALFHEPFQMLSLLMDIDVLLTKWRSAHVLLVQRQIGSKLGTGGSSGYFYLKSTVGDKYRPFMDLFSLSNYLIPNKYVKLLQEKLLQSQID